MKTSVFLLLALSIASTAGAQNVTFSGSAAAETLLTPANGDSPLNPNNAGGIDGSTNLGDLIARVEVEDDSGWKLAARARADVGDGHAAAATLTELYVTVAPAPWLTVTAGRVLEWWGSGYAWNPSAFVAPRKNPSDPGDRRGLLTGVDMLKAEATIGGTSAGAYLVSGGAVAVRASRLFGATDVSLFVHHDDGRTTPGVSLSRVIGDSLEVHAEAATGVALLGANYTFRNQLNVVAELYHSDDGLSGAQWDDFRREVASARDRESFGELNRRFRPLQMQRDYAFLRVARPWERWNVTTEILSIIGLRDGSALIRSSISWAVRPSVSLYVIDTEFVGDSEAEMSYVQIERSISFGARMYF